MKIALNSLLAATMMVGLGGVAQAQDTSTTQQTAPQPTDPVTPADPMAPTDPLDPRGPTTTQPMEPTPAPTSPTTPTPEAPMPDDSMTTDDTMDGTTADPMGENGLSTSPEPDATRPPTL